MKSLYKPVIAVVIIALAVMISLSTFQLPSPQPLTAGTEIFSAARAMEHVKKIASKIHPVGSPEHKEVHQYIINELTVLGLKPEIQKGHSESKAKGIMGAPQYSVDLKNIFARLEGLGNTNQSILMLAHYDTTLTTPGASDDTSGVAVLLETARALSSGKPLMNDIIFLFTDGEEAGLLGSELFVENIDLLQNISLVMNFEGRGNRGPSIMFETSDGNAWLMREFQKAVADPVAYSFTFDVYKMAPFDTDFTPFKQAGKGGFNFANLGGIETYHNPQDTPENQDLAVLQHHGDYALSLVKHFGNTSLENVNSSNNAVYFTLAKSWMVFYSEQWNLPLTILALVFFLAALWVGVRKRLLSGKGMISGFLVSFLMFVAASGFGIAAQTLFSAIYLKIDQIHSLDDLILARRTIIFEGHKWIVGTLILTFLILIGLSWLFRRKAAGLNLLFGSMLIWVILSVASAVYMPGAQYIFLWPLILSLAGLLIEFSTNGKFVPKYLLLFSVCALSCILIFIPVGYVLFQGLMMLGGGIPIAILSLPASLMLSDTSLFLKEVEAVSPALYHDSSGWAKEKLLTGQ